MPTAVPNWNSVLRAAPAIEYQRAGTRLISAPVSVANPAVVPSPVSTMPGRMSRG